MSLRAAHVAEFLDVAGEGAVPWSAAIRLSHGTRIRVPHVLAYPIVGSLARWRLLFPKHLMDYFRYPTVISDDLFRKDFGYQPQYNSVETLRSVGVSGAPPKGQ